jgi:RNA-directed DNA polymerase
MVKDRTLRRKKVTMSFTYTAISTGGVGSRRYVGKPVPSNKLLERIVSKENVQNAWKQVRSNKGAAGIDEVSIEDFPFTFRECWPEIRSAILEGKYTPSPVLRVEIPKSDGKSTRSLGIPTVLDRVIQQAIGQVLTPVFDPGFSESSCGFRPGRSAHQGVKDVKRFIKQGFKIAIDLDLSKFFDKSKS